MRSISNAHFYQAEVTQADRWDHGPLELAYLSEPASRGPENLVAIHDWNASQRAGFLRSAEVMSQLATIAPHVEARSNPNIILVPTVLGTTSLDVMLASLLPDAALQDAGLERRSANMTLAFPSSQKDKKDYGSRARKAFSKHVWSMIAPKARLDSSAFSMNSPLQLLAGDTRFWSHRIYRLALDRRDAWFEPTENEDEDWTPLDVIEREMLSAIPVDTRHKFSVHRPLVGGEVWDAEDAAEREDVLRAAIDGDGVMASLEPVIELLHSHRAHEDFSERYSWIKEDFERSFYSKRARVKVDLVETIDDAAAYDVDSDTAYADVLFRDLLAVLDVRERRLCIALRLGKTASEIARDEGLKGHASVSRRIQALKRRVAPLLS
jgi:hypothetical protein